MKTIECVVREAIRNTQSETPIVRRICDDAVDYLAECLIPLVCNDDKNIQDAAVLVYDRFRNGITDDATPINKPAITEVRA